MALAIGLTVAAATGQSASATGRQAYMNPHLPVQARVAGLLGRMTLPEKIGQMVQIEATQVTDKSNSCTSTGGFNLPNPVCEHQIFVNNNVGSILAGGTDVPPDTTGRGGTGNTGLDWADEYNTMRSKTVQVAFPATGLAVTPGDIDGTAPPQVELGGYQAQIGTPASLSADFTITR